MQEAEIRLQTLRGRRTTALRLALRYDDPEFQGSWALRAFRRVALMLDVLMPRSFYLTLRAAYRRSALFDLVHRRPG